MFQKKHLFSFIVQKCHEKVWLAEEEGGRSSGEPIIKKINWENKCNGLKMT